MAILRVPDYIIIVFVLLDENEHAGIAE